MRLLLTGGAGFIGSNLVRRVLAEADVERVVVLDALTYAGRRENLADVADARMVFVHGDVCDEALVAWLFAEHAFDAVAHLAAETHVDRSIAAPDAFIRTNVTGTFTLLQAARAHGTRFLHMSTDEVFGALGPTGTFSEASPYAPSSPYAASKAAADHLVRAYVRTYGLAAVIAHSCNNYGPHQLPEKLIPLVISRAIAGEPLPVYGAGKQIREWLYVADHCEALWALLVRGTPGESYVLGSGEERTNLALVEEIADLVDAELGRPAGTSRARIAFVPDRAGHDFRYAVDPAKVRAQLGWRPARTLATHLRETVRWYVARR